MTGHNTRRSNWYIYCYKGNCTFIYRKHQKQTGQTTDGEHEIRLPDKIIQRESDAISIIWLLTAQKFITSVDNPELVKTVIHATNGWTKQTSYNSQRFEQLVTEYWKWGGLKERVISRILPERLWPHLDKAKSLLGDAILSPISAIEFPSGHPILDTQTEMKINDAKAQVEYQISKIVQRRPDMEFVRVQHLNGKLYRLDCPLWIIETNIKDDQVVLVLSGITGNVLYAYVPARFMAKMTPFILIALLVIGSAMLAAWLMSFFR